MATAIAFDVAFARRGVAVKQWLLGRIVEGSLDADAAHFERVLTNATLTMHHTLAHNEYKLAIGYCGQPALVPIIHAAGAQLPAECSSHCCYRLFMKGTRRRGQVCVGANNEFACRHTHRLPLLMVQLHVVRRRQRRCSQNAR